MTFEPIITLRSRTVALLVDDVDADQILPARFLKVTRAAGLGKYLFADWRYDEDGASRAEFPLHAERARGATVLVVGRNFGCGAAREHAAWALRDFGIRAVVGTQIADAFVGNAVKNGVLPIEVDDAFRRSLVAANDAMVTIHVEARTVAIDGGRATKFPLDPFASFCLATGKDELGFLREREDAITEYERRGPGCAR